MPLVVDPIVLDPVDFLPDAAELDLSGAGFRVLDANFGEADIELEMQRQAIGEVPTTYHPPNTTTVLALGVRAEEEIDLPTAAHQLAAKVGEINTPGTEHWLRRDFEVGGNFAGSLGKRVYKATLSGLSAWQRGDSPDVSLTLVTGPYWYATVEEESGVFESEAGARELIFELAEILGTAPGLIRIRIKNEGEEDWLGLIFAGESRDMAQDGTADTTAAMAYAAADLTPKGGAEVKTVSGDKVVEHASLTAGWLSILNSKILAEELGHMTHLGVRRPYLRAEAVEGESEDVQLRLRWRPLGAMRWSENRIVPLNVVGDYQLYDLGECRPEPAALGDQRWEWDLQARAVSGAGKVRLHRVLPLPTEQFAVVKSPDVPIAADAQSTKAPGSAEDKEGVGTKVWANAGNAKVKDSSRAAVVFTALQTSHYLTMTNFGFAIPSGAAILGVIANVYRRTPTGEVKDAVVSLIKAGAVEGDNKAEPWEWHPSETNAQYGGTGDDLWGLALKPADVNASDFGLAFAVESTKAGEKIAEVNVGTLTVFYSEDANDAKVCFATRSAEFRTDGIFRQHPEDEIWGELIPEGFLPFASPSGLEGRKSRFIIIPTQGDLEDLADSGSNPLSAQAFVRPAYHVAREAA